MYEVKLDLVYTEGGLGELFGTAGVSVPYVWILAVIECLYLV